MAGEMQSDETTFTDLLSGLLGDVTGKNQAEAAAEAARQQVAFSNEALDLLRSDLAPFRNILSPNQLQDASQFTSDPFAQAGFLEKSPLFSGIKEDITQDTFNRQSAGGALGSSGTDEMLASQFLSAGNALINQQANRVNPFINVGQASAAQSGIGGADLLTGIGNAISGGQIGGQNARAAGTENIISSIAALFGGAQ